MFVSSIFISKGSERSEDGKARFINSVHPPLELFHCCFEVSKTPQKHFVWQHFCKSVTQGKVTVTASVLSQMINLLEMSCTGCAVTLSPGLWCHLSVEWPQASWHLCCCLISVLAWFKVIYKLFLESLVQIFLFWSWKSACLSVYRNWVSCCHRELWPVCKGGMWTVKESQNWDLTLEMCLGHQI